MGTTGSGTMAQIGVGGTINGYGVQVLGDVVAVERGGEEVARRRVAGLGRFVAEAGDLKLGWSAFPDGAEVVYLYDKGDDGFGYALNLTADGCSEWGYAPFRGIAVNLGWKGVRTGTGSGRVEVSIYRPAGGGPRLTRLAQVATAMPHVLTTVAAEAATRPGFLQRRRKLTGALFVQILGLGWLSNPPAGVAALT